MSGFEAAIPVFQGIGAVAGAVSGISSIFKGSPAAPVLAKPEPMPTPDEDAMKRARQRSIAAQLARSGRQSTILTDQSSDFLGA